MLLGVSLGAFALSSSGAALEKHCVQSVPNKKKAIWFKAAAFMAAASGTGVLGFISATGGIRWIAQEVIHPAEVTAFLFVFFLFVLLGWRMGWKVSRLQNATEASWLSLVSVFLCIILSFGIVWTGTATGEILLGDPDRLFRSLFNDFFASRVELAHPEDYFTALGLYVGVILLAFLTAYWTSGRKEDQWEKLAAIFPRISQFLKRGYGVDLAALRMTYAIVVLGQFTEKWIDEKIWKEWLPVGLSNGTKSVSRVLAQIDEKVSSNLGSSFRRFVEVPAKLLQLIQTGDIRWYLLFALGSGFALLSHFLRT
jgi:hypothetical protein